MHAFKEGEKVICINDRMDADDPTSEKCGKLTAGEEYTVTKVDHLWGIVALDVGIIDIGYRKLYARRFKPTKLSNKERIERRKHEIQT